jgi:hypothetical protein
MKKIKVNVVVLVSAFCLFAGNIMGIEVSARWFNASSGKYTEGLSTIPDSSIYGNFPAAIYEAGIKMGLLGSFGVNARLRYGTVSLQTMYLDNMPGGNMSTSVDAAIFGGRLDPELRLGLGPVKADIFGSLQYVLTRKNFYNWKLGSSIIAPGDTAGRFIMTYFLAGAGAKVNLDLGVLGICGEITGYPITSNSVDLLNPNGSANTTATGISYMYEGAVVFKPIPMFEISGGYRYEDVFFNENTASNNYSLSIIMNGIFIEAKAAF